MCLLDQHGDLEASMCIFKYFFKRCKFYKVIRSLKKFWKTKRLGEKNVMKKGLKFIQIFKMARIKTGLYSSQKKTGL